MYFAILPTNDPLCPVGVCPACLNCNLTGSTDISSTEIVSKADPETGCKSKLFVSSIPPCDSAINFVRDAVTSKFFLAWSSSTKALAKSNSFWVISLVVNCSPVVPGNSLFFCILFCSSISSTACSAADFLSLPVSFTMPTFFASSLVNSFKGLPLPLASLLFLAKFAPLTK